jgi:aspartyl-tRNA(Asn)/glutamyl-tRNA(Gln) amidotransferase subunit C
MKIKEDDIIKVAKLARLDLSDSEKEQYSRQLSGIIDYVEKINELDTSSVEAADHIAELSNVFRKDSVKESIGREQLQKIAPDFKDGCFVVPKIID